MTSIAAKVATHSVGMMVNFLLGRPVLKLVIILVDYFIMCISLFLLREQLNCSCTVVSAALAITLDIDGRQLLSIERFIPPPDSR